MASTNATSSRTTRLSISACFAGGSAAICWSVQSGITAVPSAPAAHFVVTWNSLGSITWS